MTVQDVDPRALLQALNDNPKTRARDLAAKLGVAEAQLVAAQVGLSATRIAASPDAIMPGLTALGDVMALTRNPSAVHERTGTYVEYHSGDHAAMVLGEEIDLRIFPRHWVSAFAVTADGDDGPRRSLQIFDAAGEAIHKVYAQGSTDLTAWDALVDALATGDPARDQATEVAPAPEGAIMREDKADTLRDEWRRMTDTHQFLRLVSKMKMNRLGAYRLAGAPFARPLSPLSVNALLSALVEAGTPIMLFVGNRGCIQIHSGAIGSLKPMGPWQNVLDPRFNLHVRADHVSEVWLVDKPTRRGTALSVEAFDADGRLILQLFGMRKEHADYTADFAAIAEELPILEAVQ